MGYYKIARTCEHCRQYETRDRTSMMRHMKSCALKNEKRENDPILGSESKTFQRVLTRKNAKTQPKENEIPIIRSHTDSSVIEREPGSLEYTNGPDYSQNSTCFQPYNRVSRVDKNSHEMHALEVAAWHSENQTSNNTRWFIQEASMGLQTPPVDQYKAINPSALQRRYLETPVRRNANQVSKDVYTPAKKDPQLFPQISKLFERVQELETKVEKLSNFSERVELIEAWLSCKRGN